MNCIADIAKAVVTGAASSIGATYMVEPVISHGQCLFFPNKVITDLENEKKELTSERDSMLVRVQQAKEKTEVIEEPVDKWLKDVENLLKEVEDLEQRMNTFNDCFHGLCPTFKRYCLCRQMAEKTEVLRQFKAKSNIQPFSHVAPLPGIQYLSSENFTFFESTKVAYSQLLEALRNDGIYMIGVYGTGGSGKTTLVTEVGKDVEESKLFDKVILVTMSQSPNIINIQEKMATMLSLDLKEKNEEDRAQRLWLCLKEKKRILIIVDDLWRKFELKDIGIHFDNDLKGRCKVLLTTRRKDVCSSMDCQESIDLGLLSTDESWTLFQKHAKIDDADSKSLNDVPRELCDECNRLPLVIKVVGSSLKRKSKDEWDMSLDYLRHPETIDDQVEKEVRDAFTRLKLSYDYLDDKAKLLFLMCSMFPEDYEIDIEALIRYAVGLGLGGEFPLYSARSRIQTGINKLLDSCLLMHVETRKNHVKMHDIVRDVAIWIAKRSEDHKIMVNIDKPLSTLAEDDCVRDYFAVCSWYHENPISRQLNAPKLEILLLHFWSRHFLNLSHATFEGIEGLKVFSLINDIDSCRPSLTLPQSTQLLTNLQTLRLNGCELGDISFIASLTRLEVLDLRFCRLNELPNKIEELKRLKLLDLSRCRIKEENYNGAIGKCSQLEELYLAACSDQYICQSVVDFLTLPKLERFAIHTTRIESDGKTRVLELVGLNIWNLKACKRKLLQIAETVGFTNLHGGCKNIIPYIIRGRNDLNSLCLFHCEKVECVIDTTSDSDDVLIPKLVELELKGLDNLKELCRGPPLHVLGFFQKLEKLCIESCPLLQSIFPWQCNLGNLKILKIRECNSVEVLFSMSVAQSLQQLEELSISYCVESKHIIASEREDGSNPSKEVVSAPTNSHFVMMPALKTVRIAYCEKLESIFSICCVEGLALLEEIIIFRDPERKYIFGECDHEDHSSHQYDNHKMLPRLVELQLERLDNLKELCRGPPLHVLGFFQKLEKLCIESCPLLQSIFPWQCNLGNLKILKIRECNSVEVLFSMSVAQSLQQLEELFIIECKELKHIIASEREDGSNPSKEVVSAPTNSHFVMPNLKKLTIAACIKLESVFPICCVQGLARLEEIVIDSVPELKYVFGECDHEDHSSHQYDNHKMLPHLDVVKLFRLKNLVGMCPENYLAKWPSQRDLSVRDCPKLSTSWIAMMAGTEQRQQHLNENVALSEDQRKHLPSKLQVLCLKDLPQLTLISWVGSTPRQILCLQCLQRLYVHRSHNMKSLLSMQVHRSLPELMSLHVHECPELEQIIEKNEEELEHLSKARVFFPKLTDITIRDCHKLKSLFSAAFVRMLPQLSSLYISDANQLEDVFRHSSVDGTINEMEFVLPNLTQLTLRQLPSFVDICQGFKLQVPKHIRLDIGRYPALSLRAI